MDYQFTANMEKELDDVADGAINKYKIINEFYKYIETCVNKIKPTNPIIYPINPIIIIDTYNNKDISLLNGKFGKYLVYDEKKFNLKQLANELHIDESELETNNKLIKEKIIEKINNPIENIIKFNLKEWTVGKTKYILRNGTYGYFIEELKLNKKKNSSLK